LIIAFGSCSVHTSSSVAEWNGVGNWDDWIIPVKMPLSIKLRKEGAWQRTS
jgi:hypothetical protein